MCRKTPQPGSTLLLRSRQTTNFLAASRQIPAGRTGSYPPFAPSLNRTEQGMSPFNQEYAFLVRWLRYLEARKSLRNGASVARFNHCPRIEWAGLCWCRNAAHAKKSRRMRGNAACHASFCCFFGQISQAGTAESSPRRVRRLPRGQDAQARDAGSPALAGGVSPPRPR